MLLLLFQPNLQRFAPIPIVSAGPAVLGTPPIGVPLTAIAIVSAGASALGTPIIGGPLAATPITSAGTSVLGTPAIGQVHVLTAVPITSAGTSILDTPAIAQAQVLSAVPIVSAGPSQLDTPQVYPPLTAAAVVSGGQAQLDTPIIIPGGPAIPAVTTPRVQTLSIPFLSIVQRIDGDFNRSRVHELAYEFETPLRMRRFYINPMTAGAYGEEQIVTESSMALETEAGQVLTE